MRTFFALVCLSLALSAYGQNDPQDATGASAPGAGSVQNGGEPLPTSYREISLGMSLDDLRAALSKDALFGYRGDEDVSFIPSREETYLETVGASFIRRALFQTKADKVYAMTFTLNASLVDHYSVFTTLVKKYGEPAYLDPGQAVWEDENTRLSIERPLTLKYIDKAIFTSIVDESGARKNHEIQLREEFLSDF
ncbi:MAG: hypothetical protein LBL45_13440 [Treponema sp.]|jgi:hypothetical protein|nr:hypothetical protein [Treponema sp.]